jgi:uncharacterized protein YukE
MLTTAETIRSLQVPEGRRLYRDFFYDRLLRNNRVFQTLIECWKLAVRGLDLQISDGRSIHFETYLGRRLGTRVFLEEILGRYYYNTIQGWVYIAAIVLIVGVGLYLGGYDFRFAIAGFALQAFFLLLLAIVTMFSPMEDSAAPDSMGMSEPQMTALNRAVKDMTNAVTDIFRLISQTDFRQDVLLTKLTENQAKIMSSSTRQMIDTLEETNRILSDLRAGITGAAGDETQSVSTSRDDDKLRDFLLRPRPGEDNANDSSSNAG